MFQARPHAEHARFRARLQRLSAAVASQRLGVYALSGLAAGASLGALGAAAMWLVRRAPWVALPTVCGALGALLGLAIGHRRRWSLGTLAQVIDARYGLPETVSVAASVAPEHRAAPLFFAAANEALRGVEARALRPALRPWHGLALGALGVQLGLAAARGGAAAHAPSVTEAATVRLTEIELPSLRAVARLSVLRSGDLRRDAQLARIADTARRLRAEAPRGVDPRAALRTLDALSAQLEAEREGRAALDRAAGLERAAQRLAAAGFPEAAEALRAHDWAGLDRQLEQLADAREARDRARAREALSDAAAQLSDPALAEALNDEADLLRQRADRNSLLRQLSEALGEDPAVQRAAEHLARRGDAEAARDLAARLEAALAGLSASERARLTERLRREATRAEGLSRFEESASTAALMSPEALLETLRALAQSADPPFDEPREDGATADERPGAMPWPTLQRGGTRAMRRQAALDAAQAGVSAAREAVEGQGGGGEGGGGGGRGGGAAGHEGRTDAVSAESFRARVTGRLHRGGSGLGQAAGTQRGRAGGVASATRSDAPEGATPAALRGVEVSEIPASYRAHVQRYFEP